LPCRTDERASQKLAFRSCVCVHNVGFDYAGGCGPDRMALGS
jgi:hypothetical protein